MSKFIDVTMRLIDDFTGPFNKAITNMKNQARETINAGKQIESAGKSISSVGSGLTKNVTLPILGAGAAIIKVSADFEEKMAGVKAITEATDTQFESLRTQAIKLGAETAFSAGEVADAMTEMAKAGWSFEDIQAGMKGVLDATAASGESLSSTSTIIADAITGFGLGASQSGEVADLLTQAANAGTIGISDLGESFKYIAPLAQSMGLSISDVTTAVSAMSMSGIKGSQAGTSLRTTLANLAKPTKAMQQAMDDLGISVTNKDGSFKSLDDIVGILRGSFGKLTDKQKAYYATTLAGKEGMSGLLSLLNLTAEEYDNIAAKMDNSNGIAKQTADIMRDNLNAQVEELTGSLESLAIVLGETLTPYATGIVTKLTEFVNSLIAMDESTRNTILKIAAFAAVIGPVITIFGKIVGFVGVAVTKFGQLSLMIGEAGGVFALLSGPAGIVIGVLLGIVAAGILVYKNWDKIKEFGKKSWDYIKDIVAKLGIDFDGMKERVGELADRFGTAWGKMKDGAKAFWDLVGPIFGGLVDIFKVYLPLAIGTVIGTLENWFYIATNIIANIIDAFGALGDFVKNVFTGNFNDAFSSLVTIFEKIMAAVTNIITTPINALIAILNGAIKAINKIGFDIPDWVPKYGGQSFKLNIPEIPSIPMLYTGTKDWQGGPAMVHDRGAEIIDLPSGTTVYPHDKSLEIARKEGAASARGNITVAKLADTIIVREDADIDKIASALVDKLLKTANNTGGVLIGDMA